MPTPSLKRTLSLPLFTAYGLGTMVGAGFYALLGKVAAEAGMRTPLAFLVAAVVAGFSALSFSELSARYPSSAGEARYVGEAFRRRWLSTLVGWLVITTGVVSAATLANAFAGFLQDLLPVHHGATIVVLVLVLGAVAAWGILESAWLAALITVIEVGGLVWVLAVTGRHLRELPARAFEMLPSLDGASSSGVMLGAFLAFYAFIGFEDMVNMAEEVKQPRRNLPRGILLAFAATALLYLLVSTAGVLAVAPAELAQSRTPLALLTGGPAGGRSLALSMISLLAGVNGALVQILMAARVAYGLASKGGAPRLLGAIHPRTRTPVRATALMSAVVLVLALWFPIVTLAKATSSVILVVFVLVNLALWRIQTREGAPPPGRSGRRWVPLVGGLLCAGLLVHQAVALARA
jgi:APA family basic amino acid/polyamine antiporter